MTSQLKCLDLLLNWCLQYTFVYLLFIIIAKQLLTFGQEIRHCARDCLRGEAVLYIVSRSLDPRESGDGASSSSVVNVASNQHNGVRADDMPIIDMVSESLRKQIRDGKYVNLASFLIPDFETPNFTTNELSGLELTTKSQRSPPR